MAEIRRFPALRHLRSESTSFIAYHRSGRLASSGRGLAFWFVPFAASIVEVPCDDRDLPFLFHGRSSDFQDVVTQGVVTYRVVDPLKVAERVDFTIDLNTGAYRKTPLDQVAQILTQLSQEMVLGYMTQMPLRDLLSAGVDPVRERIQTGLAVDPGLESAGLNVVSVRVAAVAPTAELEKALQTPTREAIQEQADVATFQRRALAVEKERAIQENELQTQIELTRRQEALIRQKGQNERLKANEQAEAAAIAAKAEAERRRLDSDTQAGSIRVVEQARVEAEREKMQIYREMPLGVLLGLAAQELAEKLQTIEHLNITPDLLGPLFTGFVEAGARYLDGRPELPVRQD
ncbi:MAG: band 7 protein [Deltaproteobacteria bacterium]|nr:band 7 protein [Deltaproteobacteria bacterium]